MNYKNDTFCFLLQEVSSKYHKIASKYHKSSIMQNKSIIISTNA